MSLLPDTRLSLIANLGDCTNDQAWSEFIHIYHSSMLRFCQSRGLSLEDALEVVQDVCIVVHKSAARWESSGRSGSFRTWLFETARRLCLASLRKRNRGDTISLLSAIDLVATTPNLVEETEVAEWERWAFYWACGQVQSTSQPNTWRAFWLTAVEAQSAEQVATELSMSVGAVYAAKCRILSRIRAVVSELSQGEYRANS